MSNPADDAALRQALPAQMFGRFVGNTMFRAVFPYTRTIADDLGTSLSTFGWLLSARELAGAASLPLGRVVDGGRHRQWMVLASGLGAIAALGMWIGTSVWLVGAALVTFGVAKPAYDIAMGAWIGENVPYERRGRIVGITELSWAGAFLIGLPLLAPLVDRVSWRAPYAVLLVAQLAAGALLWRRLPIDTRRPKVDMARRITFTPRGAWLVPAVMALVAGHQLTIVTFGAWLDDEHGLDAEGLGLVAMGLGVAELVGTLVVVATSDRLGKRVTMFVGAAAMIPPLLLFGSASSTAASVVAVAVVLGAFETAFVSSLPLATEVAPESRGAVLGVMAASWTVTRAGGSIVGTAIYDRHGIGVVGVVAATAVAACVLIVGLLFREP